MHALVVYESMFGNTLAIATAVAEGVGSRVRVELVEVGRAPTLVDPAVGLLVVGGPTHAHGLSSPDSRRSAARKTTRDLVSPGIGLREWLGGLRGSPAVATAAFDTTIRGPRLLWGSAARAADERLRSRGFRQVAPPESFNVAGPLGPFEKVLLAGEVDRARAWGTAIAERYLAALSPEERAGVESAATIG